MMLQIQIWLGALLTLMIMSFLYRDNPFYKFAEHLFVGVSAAYWMVQGVWQTLLPNMLFKIHPPLARSVLPAVADAEPELHYILPGVFGLLMLARLVPRIGWLSRWALAFVVGTTAGYNFVRYLQSDFMPQVAATLQPLLVFQGGNLNIGATISHTVLVIGVIAGLVYFFFSKEHRGAFGAASKVGIWVLLVAFGASFGYTVMARISLLMGRLQFLLRDWLHIIP
jgi:hypothetical protein